MRDFASCFSEHAIKVADSACSSRSSTSTSSIISANDSFSNQASITNLYQTQASTEKDLLIKVTWSRTPLGQILSLGVDDDPYSHNWNPNFITCHKLTKKKGTKSSVSGTSVIGLHWDYSIATFNSGPEPTSNFYVVIIVDAKVVLLLGDLSEEYIEKFQEVVHVSKSSLVGRREQVFGSEVFTTKARFSEEEKDHDIVIRCNESELLVNIDKKRVVFVTKLHWNFRGHQAVYVDNAIVDVMWDLRDWWFSNRKGYAVFMFRKRSAKESQLWFEEEMLQRDRGVSGFSLLIQAFKRMI